MAISGESLQVRWKLLDLFTKNVDFRQRRAREIWGGRCSRRGNVAFKHCRCKVSLAHWFPCRSAYTGHTHTFLHSNNVQVEPNVPVKPEQQTKSEQAPGQADEIESDRAPEPAGQTQQHSESSHNKGNTTLKSSSAVVTSLPLLHCLLILQASCPAAAAAVRQRRRHLTCQPRFFFLFFLSNMQSQTSRPLVELILDFLLHRRSSRREAEDVSASCPPAWPQWLQNLVTDSNFKITSGWLTISSKKNVFFFFRGKRL